MARDGIGQCSACRSHFAYQLIHNGFNDTAYAYCDRCGTTAFLSCLYDQIRTAAQLSVHGPISESAEPFLAPCICGGRFRAHASPRCPKCGKALSAVDAREWIEADHQEGVRKGWRWEGSWDGLYCLVVAGRSVKDNWLTASENHEA